MTECERKEEVEEGRCEEEKKELAGEESFGFTSPYIN